MIKEYFLIFCSCVLLIAAPTRNVNRASQVHCRVSGYFLGFNFRLTGIQADIGLAQMTRVNDLIKKKIEIANHYINEFKNQKYFNYVKNKVWAFNTYWMFGIVIQNKKITASKFINLLKKENI